MDDIFPAGRKRGGGATGGSGSEARVQVGVETGVEVESLLGLCLTAVVNNLDLVADVSRVDPHLLEEILPHCSAAQLQRIEDATKGCDLTDVADPLWRQMYCKRFGDASADNAEAKMKAARVLYPWRQLYEARLAVLKRKQQESGERLLAKYKQAEQEKRSRQVQMCTKLPESSRKRSRGCGGGSRSSSIACSSLLNKAKTQFARSVTAQVQRGISRPTQAVENARALQGPVTSFGKSVAGPGQSTSIVGAQSLRGVQATATGVSRGLARAQPERGSSRAMVGVSAGTTVIRQGGVIVRKGSSTATASASSHRRQQQTCYRKHAQSSGVTHIPK